MYPGNWFTNYYSKKEEFIKKIDKHKLGRNFEEFVVVCACRNVKIIESGGLLTLEYIDSCIIDVIKLIEKAKSVLIKSLGHRDELKRKFSEDIEKFQEIKDILEKNKKILYEEEEKL